MRCERCGRCGAARRVGVMCKCVCEVEREGQDDREDVFAFLEVSRPQLNCLSV